MHAQLTQHLNPLQVHCDRMLDDTRHAIDGFDEARIVFWQLVDTGLLRKCRIAAIRQAGDDELGERRQMRQKGVLALGVSEPALRGQ